MQQQNEKYLPKFKTAFLQSVKEYGPAFDDEDFATYLAKSLLSSTNFMVEASKLTKELKEKDKAQKKLEEFIHHGRPLLHQKFDNLLKKAYPSFQSQNKAKYVEYLVSLTQGPTGFAKYKEIFESLAGPNVKQIPPYFNEFKTAVTQGQKDKMWEIFKKNFPEYEKLSGSKYIDYLWSLMNKRGEDAAKLYPEIGRALSTPPQDSHTLPPYWSDYKTAQTEMDKDKCRESFRNNFPEMHKQVGNKYIDFIFSLVRPEEAPRRHRDFIEGLANAGARFPPLWQEFQDKESRRHGDVKEMIKKKHPEHCEGQYGGKFLEYIFNQAHSDPQTHDAIIKEITQDTKLTPPKWYEFLRAELGDERLKKLEVIRRDPQFLTYIEYRKQRFEQYKQNYVGRTTSEQEQKQFNNMKMYVEQLTTIINLFQKLLYFNLYQSHFGQIFAFFEKDFDAYKKNNAARAAAASQETHEQKDTLPKDPRTQPLNQQNMPTAPTNPQHHQQNQNQNYMRQSTNYSDPLSQGHSQSHPQGHSQGHSTNQMPTTSKDSYQSQSQSQSQSQVSSHNYPQQSQQQYSQHSTPTHSTHSTAHSTAHQTPNLHSSQNLHQNAHQSTHQNPHQNTYQQQQQRSSAYSQQQQQQPSHTTSQQQPTNIAPTHPHSQPTQQSRAPQTQNAPYSQPHAGMPQKTNPLQSHTSGYQMGQQQQTQQYPQTASQPQTSQPSNKYMAHSQPTTQHHQTAPQVAQHQQNQYANPHHPQQTTQQTMHGGQMPLQSPTKQNPLHAQVPPQMKPQAQPMQPIKQVPSPNLNQNAMPHQTHQTQPSKPTMSSYDMMKMQSASSGYEQKQQQQPQVPSLQPTEPLGASQPNKYQYKPTYDSKAGMSHSAAATSQQSQLSSSQAFGSAQQSSGSGQMQIEAPYMSRDSQVHPQQVQAPLQTQQPHHVQPHVPTHTQPHVQPQQQPQPQVQKAPIIQGQKADMKRPRFTEKEKFDNFNLDGITLEDGERRLGEVYKKLKNPYGNYEIIDNFIQNLYTELAESEAENKVEKRLKTNPDPSQEVNIFPDKSKTAMPIEQTNNVKPPQTFIQQQPINPFENDITDIKMDDRFKVEDKGNHSAPSFDLVIYKNNDGIISFHDKLVMRLEKDGIPKISIQEMANLSEFFIEYKDMLEDALTKGRLKEVLELWLEFIEKCAMKLESKLSAFDDLFG